MEKTERETVLIVDDEVDLRNAIVTYLTQEGYEVHAASNGEEALERVKSVPFDRHEAPRH
jgi:CheY-like chemotaxis protein